MTTKELFDPIQLALAAKFGEGKWLMATAGSSPYLNYELIGTLKLNPSKFRRVRPPRRSGAARGPVYTRTSCCSAMCPTTIGSRVLRGFDAQRSGDLESSSSRRMRQAQGTTTGHRTTTTRTSRSS